MQLDRIEGKIYLKREPIQDPLVIEFTMDEQMWEQWGASRDHLVAAGTSLILEAIHKALQIQQMEEV